VWTDRGSPLLFHSLDLVKEVRARLGRDWHVELAMRYGSPPIDKAIELFRRAEVDRIIVFPLFPQYASSSTGSALEAVYSQAARAWNVPQLSAIGAFYDHPLFIEACRQAGAPVLADRQPDHVLFSFHGLPERQIRKSDDTGRHCFASDDCCDRIAGPNRNCYRAQCYATARALAAALELPATKWSVSFQSRLGRTPWIKPYTDVVIPQLAARGIRKLAVFCPAFVADCLETLEEIGIRAAEQWRQVGGAELTLVPAVNSSSAWVDTVVQMVRDHAGRATARDPAPALGIDRRGGGEIGR
jgi:ferrochelatase